jgi:hypothetical protein
MEKTVDMVLNTMDEAVLRMMLETKGGNSAGCDMPEIRKRLRVLMLDEQQRTTAKGPQPLVVGPPQAEKGAEDKALVLSIISLADMLDYSLTDRNERHFEVSISAEMLVCLISRHHASIIYHAIKNVTIYDADDPAAPEASPTAGATATDELLMPKVFSSLMQRYLTSDGANPADDDLLAMFMAFRFFDRHGRGALSKPQLEKVLQVRYSHFLRTCCAPRPGMSMLALCTDTYIPPGSALSPNPSLPFPSVQEASLPILTGFW